MHFDTPAREPDDHAGASWWRELTRYQWFVFLVASLGWLFDTMDQQLFTMRASRRSRGCSMWRPVIRQRPDGSTSTAVTPPRSS